MARHELFHKSYLSKYPESCDPNVNADLLYTGPYKVTDLLEGTNMTYGKAILSPTRTYAPIISALLKRHRKEVNGIMHCTGGGQTKCLKFGSNLRYVKDNLFPCPPLFRAIQKSSNIAWRDMYEIFNMGHRMEIYGPADLFPKVKAICDAYNLECRIVGRVEATSHPDGKNELLLLTEEGSNAYFQA